MRRLAGISGALSGSEGIWMGETHVAAALRSANHHHGESETAIYLVSGHPGFIFLHDGTETRIETSPSDYVYVPPFCPHPEATASAHRDVRVGSAPTRQEAIAVNLPALCPRRGAWPRRHRMCPAAGRPGSGGPEGRAGGCLGCPHALQYLALARPALG